jgi:hypothetical protein
VEVVHNVNAAASVGLARLRICACCNFGVVTCRRYFPLPPLTSDERKLVPIKWTAPFRREVHKGRRRAVNLLASHTLPSL